jgi:hypothetical protein
MTYKSVLVLIMLVVPLFAQYGFDFSCLDDTMQIIGDTTTLVEFRFRLENTGSVPDSFAFDCRVVDSVPGWDELFCAGGLCAVPGIILYDYLAAGQVDTSIDVTVYPGLNYGVEVLNLKVHSVGDPNLQDSISVIVEKVVAIEDAGESIVSHGQIRAFPNPFSVLTTVNFDMGQHAERMVLNVYDAAGRLVKSFSVTSPVIGHQASVRWDGTDQAGRPLASGVYFLKVEGQDSSARVVLIM